MVIVTMGAREPRSAVADHRDCFAPSKCKISDSENGHIAGLDVRLMVAEKVCGGLLLAWNVLPENYRNVGLRLPLVGRISIIVRAISSVSKLVSSLQTRLGGGRQDDTHELFARRRRHLADGPPRPELKITYKATANTR